MSETLERKHPRKISKLLIYPKFQVSIILTSFLVMSCVFAVIAFQLNRSFQEFHDIGTQIHLDAKHPFFRLIDFQADRLFFDLLLAFLVGQIASGFLVLMISHRLAGPIVRTLSYFRGISEEGRVNRPLSFRKGDFFTELPPVINRALDVLSHEKEDGKA